MYNKNANGIAITPAVSEPVWANMLTSVYTDTNDDGSLKLEGWSSGKTLAFGWGSFDEEVRTLQEDCDENSLSSCKTMRGPFDGDTKIITKTFSGMENHTELSLTLRLWRVDSWDRNDAVFVELFDVDADGDDTPFHTSTIAPTQILWNDMTCTPPWVEYVVPSGNNDGQMQPGPLYQP